MSSSGATPAAPPIAFQRPVARSRDQVAASESVAFPELVWAHYLRQRELHEQHELHGPAEAEFRAQLERFTEEQGTIINAYWCVHEASAVAMDPEDAPSRALLARCDRDLASPPPAFDGVVDLDK